MDFSSMPDVAIHAHHAATHVAHVAKTCTMAAPVIKQGFSMLTMFLTSMGSMAAGFGLGWYIKGRGMTGVQIDLNNVKTDVENLKARFSTPVAAPTA